MGYFGKRGANNVALIGVVLVVIVLIAVYALSSGKFNLGGPGGSTSTGFSASSNISSSTILTGHSALLFLSFLNPYNQSIDARVNLSVGAPSFITVSNPSRHVLMQANMSKPSSIDFNVTCIGSAQQSTYLLSVEMPDFWQNLTTSVVTYPYGTSSSLIPQQIYDNNNYGFITMSADPVTIETQVPASLQEPINIVFSPTTYDNGEPYSKMIVGSPDDYISQVTISILNSSSAGGIASAFVYYNGNSYPLVQTSPGVLGVTLSNVYMQLVKSGLPLEVTALNLGRTSQSVVKVAVKYNYFFSLTGTPSVITCQ